MTLSTIRPAGMRDETRKLVGMVLIPFGDSLKPSENFIEIESDPNHDPPVKLTQRIDFV
jgi:hypothetical protein